MASGDGVADMETTLAVDFREEVVDFDVEDLVLDDTGEAVEDLDDVVESSTLQGYWDDSMWLVYYVPSLTNQRR